MGLVFLFAILMLAGCAGGHGASAPEPQLAKKSPVVAVAGASEAAVASPTPVKLIVTRGDPVTVLEGERDENALYAPVSLALRDGRFDPGRPRRATSRHGRRALRGAAQVLAAGERALSDGVSRPAGRSID